MKVDDIISAVEDPSVMQGFVRYTLKGEIVATLPLGVAAPEEYDQMRLCAEDLAAFEAFVAARREETRH